MSEELNETKILMIGENLRKFRLLRGLKQEELCEGLCSVSQLSKIENGKAVVREEMLAQLAARLGVTIAQISTTDAYLDELTERLRLARTASSARNVDKALEIAEEVAQQALAAGYAELFSEALFFLAFHYNDTQQSQKVIDQLHDAFERGLPITKLQYVNLYDELGRAHTALGQMEQAYEWFWQAEKAFSSLTDVEESAMLRPLYKLASLHARLRNNRTGLRYAQRALEIATVQGKMIWKVRAMNAKGTFLFRLGQYDEAIECFEQILREAQNNALLFDVGSCTNNLGCLYMEQGRYGQALSLMQRALQVYELMGDDYYMCEPLLNLAELAQLEQRPMQCRQYVERVLEMLERIGGPVYLYRGRAYRILARNSRACGDERGYLAGLQKSLDVYVQHGVLFEGVEVALELAEALYEAHDSRALEAYRMLVDLQRRSERFSAR